MSTSEAFALAGLDCQVLFELASGGMATVSLARQLGDAGFERLVAVKRVHRHLVEDPEVFAMASDEARVAALVRHPNVVSVIGVHDARGELLLIQEYVEGVPLSRLLRLLAERGARLPVPVALAIALDAAKGLAATHDAVDLRGEPLAIVHRDVSPQNLLVGADGVTRVIDFGIARSERRMTMTRTGVLKGKLPYMAPEQIEEQTVDRRADVYALAAVLFEMVTGTRAFEAGDDSALMAKILSGALDFEPVPELVRGVIEQAMQRSPAARCATANEFARRLREVGGAAAEEEVAALVAALFGEELAARRARIAQRIAECEESVETTGALNPAKAQIKPATAGSPAAAHSIGSAGKRLLPLGLGLGLFAAGWFFANRPTGQPLPNEQASGSNGESSRLEFPQSAEPLAPVARTSDAAPSATAMPVLALEPLPSTRSSVNSSSRSLSIRPSASASVSGTRTDLHPSPYAPP